MKGIAGYELSFSDIGLFSKIISDYLEERESVRPFYHRKPSWNHFIKQAKEKKFNKNQRGSLVSALRRQYEGIENTNCIKEQIKQLSNENTFTITTGHQLCLFSGPLYFFSKIITVLKCCLELNKRQSDLVFIPVFWMASEDHDFEEINHFYFQHSKLEWTQSKGGPVGRLSTESLQTVFDEFRSKLADSPESEFLAELFQYCYLNSKTLAEATRKFVHHWFGDYGVVIIDGDDKELKQSFSPIVREEILNKVGYHQITRTNKRLSDSGYHVQATPREINLFYINGHLRERIVQKESRFFVHNINHSFSKEDIIKKLEESPECFSPNALLRPIYQEQILPNICYVGGGRELAYWFQLKDYFASQNVQFPILLLRNTVLVLNHSLNRKLIKLRINPKELFLTKDRLNEIIVRKHSNLDLNFDHYHKTVEQLFEELEIVAKKTDVSFIGAVQAQEKKQKRGLEKLEKRLLKAEKRKLSDHVLRTQLIREALFPKGILQERVVNISTFIDCYGIEFFKHLMKKIRPLDNEVSVFILTPSSMK